MPPLTVLDAVLATVSVSIVYWFWTTSNKKHVQLPPGPRGLPILGNLFSMPTHHEWLTFAKWGDVWGGILSVSLPGQTVIILNSFDIATELLDKRSTKYSDRPVVPMASLVGLDLSLPLLPYGDSFRAQRKYFHQLMGSPSSAATFDRAQELETHRFLQYTAADPDNLAAHVRRQWTAGAVILRISHGYEVQDEDDPFVRLANDVTEYFSQTVTPGGFLVNIIPQLLYLPEWFPGGGFKKIARAWEKTKERAVEEPHAFVKAQMAAGTALPSFTSMLLEREGISEWDEFNIKWAALVVYGGGADTTVSANYALYNVLALNPWVQAKAQAEIDSVVGNKRLPRIADRVSLPFINAISLEILRFHAVVPIPVPHRVTEDDVYDGYFIPRGSTVLANTWYMTHDPRRYKDPTRFNPDRFVRSKDHEPEMDPRQICFGFGRRTCPGRFMADSSVFIFCAMTLAVFDVSRHRVNGVEEELSHSQMPGTISHPTPFKCTIKPRSAKALALINSEL